MIFFNPTAYCAHYVYFNHLVTHMLLYNKELGLQFKDHPPYSVSSHCTQSENTTTGLEKWASVNLVLFHIASHTTKPPTPTCTRISGSVVEILDNSKHYQPQCQSIFVSCTGLSVAVLGVDPAFGLSFFFCMHVSGCVCMTVCVSVNVTVHTFASVMACLCVYLN